MKPTELMRVLNTAGRGTVLTETRLRRHRNRAGYTIGDARTINLFRYAAWLTLEHFAPKEPPLDYAEQKRRQAQRNAELVRAAQDIGELPPVADPQRKTAAQQSFRTFCETYFAEVFYLPWSDDHLRVIDKIERAVRTGGLFAMACPRGMGKTVLCQTAVLWAALTNHFAPTSGSNPIPSQSAPTAPKNAVTAPNANNAVAPAAASPANLSATIHPLR